MQEHRRSKRRERGNQDEVRSGVIGVLEQPFVHTFNTEASKRAGSFTESLARFLRVSAPTLLFSNI